MLSSPSICWEVVETISEPPAGDVSPGEPPKDDTFNEQDVDVDEDVAAAALEPVDCCSCLGDEDAEDDGCSCLGDEDADEDDKQDAEDEDEDAVEDEDDDEDDCTAPAFSSSSVTGRR